MTTQPETLVTPGMLQAKNAWSPPVASPPIALSDIRKWAIAVYWPEQPPRIFWDEAYAQSTHWGGIITPNDFNPFAWPINPMPRVSIPDIPPMGSGVGARVMNGGQVDVYHAPMRPGDVITTTSALVDWNERVGRLGLTIFSYTETRWTNQRGELVKTRTSTSVRY